MSIHRLKYSQSNYNWKFRFLNNLWTSSHSQSIQLMNAFFIDWIFLLLILYFIIAPKTTQQLFQFCFNVAFWLIWRFDVRQSQANVETTLCTLKLKFTTLNDVESTLFISPLISVDFNVRECRNNVVIFIVDFDNVGQRQNNVVNVIICKKLKNKLWIKNKIIYLNIK